MDPHSLEHVAVWLEDGLQDEEVLPQALEWASRLNLPLRAVVSLERIGKPRTAVAENFEALQTATSQRGIALEVFMWPGDGDLGMDRFVRPHGLCVCIDDVSSQRHEDLLHRAAANHENAVLLCAPKCGAIKRVLVLDDHSDPNAKFLESVASFCRALDTQPIILIVAKSEREAHRRQAFAEGFCNSLRLFADFDFVVGCDLRSAVGRVASWRNCSHLVIERRTAASWRQSPDGQGLNAFRGLLDSLSLLALPAAVALDVPQKIQRDGMRLLRKLATSPPIKLAKQVIQIEVQS